MAAVKARRTQRQSRSVGSLVEGSRRPSPAAESALERLDEMCRNSTYTTHHGYLYGPQATREGHERSFRPTSTREQVAEEEAHGWGSSSGAADEPWRFQTTHNRIYVNHGPAARPANTTKSDVRTLIEPRLERSRQALAEKEAQEMARRARLASAPEAKVELVAYGPKPLGEMKGNFVGGNAPMKSEFKASYGVEKFAQSTHARYKQPGKPLPLAKAHKEPLWGAV
jgi:hypothetical protein